ncbi:MAG TPA: hypothetical protein VIJ95_17655 [Hanamia sp.]
MKKFLKVLFITVIAGVSTFFVQSSFAQSPDIVKAAPKQAKVILDNKEVRVISFWANPGDKTPMHHHPDYLTYSVNGGTTTYTMPDGTTKEVVSKAGEAQWHEAVEHASENTGKTKMHVILVEFKKSKM